MVYVNDSSEVRDKKEDVETAKREIEIAALEKKIEMIEKEIDSIEKEKEMLEQQREETEKYWDKLIEEQEKYWDQLIKSMEDYKSKWEEIQEIQEQAEFLASFNSITGGKWTLEDIDNMSPEMLEDFKTQYTALLADIYSGNESMTQALSQTLGVSADQMGSYLSSTAGQTELMVTAITNLNTPLNEAADALGQVKSVLGDGLEFKVDENIGKSAEAIKDIAESTNNIDSSKVSGLATELGKVSSAISGGGTGTGLSGAISDATQSLDDMSSVDLSPISTALGDIGGDGLIGQFGKLTTEINNAKGAIGSAGASAGGQGGEGGGAEGAAAGLSGAITSLQETANSALGAEGGEPGTVNGDFAMMKSEISGATALIGTGDSGEETLTGTIIALPDNVTQPINDVKSLFSELAGIISECAGAAAEIVASLEKASNIKIGNLYSFNGPGFGGAEFTGTAYARGNWSAKSKGSYGTSLVGELGEELVVHKDGTFETVGTNGAEFTQIKPSDIVFNHKQTEDLLRDGHINTRGKAYANGNFTPLTPTELSKYQAFDKMSDIQTKLDLGNKVLSNIDRKVETIVHNEKTINNAPVINGGINITCPGVTSDEVLKQVGIGLQKEFSGIYMNAYQRVMIK